jgi:uncharacterized damage-inducible protein DinB
MLPMFEAYFERLEALHGGVKQALDGLPAEALDWVPGPDMNSLCVLVMHLAGAERYWIGDVAGEDLSGRVRDDEFRAAGLDGDALVRRLDEVLAHSRGVLERLSAADLDAEHISPRDGRTFTVAWALWHALEHTALHLGHAQIVRQLWDQGLG